MDIRYILRNIFLIFHVKVRFSNIECHLSLSSICILFIRDQKTRERKEERKKTTKRRRKRKEEYQKGGVLAQSITKYESEK